MVTVPSFAEVDPVESTETWLNPQEEVIPTMYETSSEKFGSNVLDVISTGTSEGLKLAANVGAMLLVFVA